VAERGDQVGQLVLGVEVARPDALGVPAVDDRLLRMR
jgi:hypothetical protein